MIYLTGDTHGRFERIGAFCDKMQTDRDDILIILGDAGINFHADARDILCKEYLARLPITLFCIHGNHERRPESLDVYDEREWHGGQVFTEDRYPNILFAKDGETIVLGGVFHDTITKGVDKVPLLGDIPGIKRLFSKESERHQKRELVIFVTPHILKQGERMEMAKKEKHFKQVEKVKK